MGKAGHLPIPDIIVLSLIVSTDADIARFSDARHGCTLLLFSCLCKEISLFAAYLARCTVS